jgi:hypothetical protein
MLGQPYCPPPMVFEKKAVPPPERRVLTKAANVTVHNKTQTLKLVQDAIAVKESQQRE